MGKKELVNVLKSIKDVLITCGEKNKASARTIEKCMGKYENTIKYNGELLRRYWVNTLELKKLGK